MTRLSFFVFLTCLVLGGWSAGAVEAYEGAYEGIWEGTTSQGHPLAFEVVNGGLLALELTWTDPCNTVRKVRISFCANCPSIPLLDGAELTLHNSGHEALDAFAGQFASGAASAGSARLETTACSGVTQIDWSATNANPVEPQPSADQGAATSVEATSWGAVKGAASGWTRPEGRGRL